LCPVYSQLNKGVISKPLKSSGIGDSLFPFLETESVKSRKSKLTAKLHTGVDAKSKLSVLTAKLHMGVDAKSKIAILTAKLHTGVDAKSKIAILTAKLHTAGASG
jgi:hypothetical protein